MVRRMNRIYEMLERLRSDVERYREDKIKAVHTDDKIQAAYLMGKEEATLYCYHLLAGLTSLEIEMEFEASMRILNSLKKMGD